MGHPFDPYHAWLGIPSKDQPPNHYRLLGLALWEADHEVIINAVKQRTAHVKSKQEGGHAAEARILLVNIKEAGVCLLTPAKKEEYDKALRTGLRKNGNGHRKGSWRTDDDGGPAQQQIKTAHSLPVAKRLTTAKQPAKKQDKQPAATRSAAAPTPSVQPDRNRGTKGEPEQAAPSGGDPPSVSGSSRGSRPRKRRNKSSWLTIVRLLVLVVVAAGVAIGVAYHRGIFTEGSAEGDAVDLADAADPAGDTTDKPRAEAAPTITTADSDVERSLADLLVSDDSTEQNTAIPDLGQLDELTDEPWAGLFDDESGGNESDPPDPFTDESQSASAVVTAPESRRRPVPSQEAQDEAKGTARQIFRDDISAARTSEAKIELARKFISYAEHVKKDPAARYALFILARDLAASAGDSQLSLQTVNQLANEYEIDILEMESHTIERAIDSARNAQVLHRLEETSRELIDEAARDSRYEMALNLVRTSLKQAKQMRSEGLASKYSKLLKNIEGRKARYEVTRRAMETLQSNPDDPDANLVVGEHLVITEDDWEQALPHLAKGADEQLATSANMELSDLPDARAKIALAESWEKMAIARRGKQEETVYLRRAIHWFQESLPQLDGLDRIATSKKLEELGDAVELATAQTTAESLDQFAKLPKFAERFIGKHEYLATGKKAEQTVSKIWDFQSNHQVTENDVPIGKWSVAEGTS